MLRQSVIKNLSGSLSYTINGKAYSLNLKGRLKGQNEHLNFNIQIFNAFDHAIIQADIKCLEKIQLKDVRLSSDFKYYDNDRVFCNGYQSWSESHLAYVDEKLPSLSTLSRPYLKYSGDYSFYRPKPGIKHSWSYSYIQSDDQVLLFCGSLDESKAYTIIEHECDKKHIHFSKDVNGLEIDGNWQAFHLLLYDGKRMDAFQFWAEKLKLKKKANVKKTGWNSWYRHKNKINEKRILNNLASYNSESVSLDYFQIDDGWQKSIGDWEVDSKKFPDGLNGIADQIKDMDMSAGIWMAPFICERNSEIYKKKKEWLAKKNGKPIKVGYSLDWSGWFYLLDLNNEEVKTYIGNRIKLLKDAGFRLFKMDFLYAAGLASIKNKSRAEIIESSLRWLKEMTEGCETIFCGVPVISALGQCDYLRIGPDIHTDLDYKWLRRLKFRERPSFINAMKNTILRAELSAYGSINDPDVFFLNNNGTSLTDMQIQSQFYLNYICGGLMFSSDMWGEASKNMKKIYTSMFPLKHPAILSIDRQKEAYFIHFKIAEQNYELIINLSADTVQVQVNDYGDYYDMISKRFIKGKEAINLEAATALCILKVAHADKAYLKDPEHLFHKSIL